MSAAIPGKTPRHGRHARRRASTRTLTAIIGVASVLLFGGAAAETQAAWTDSESVSGSFTAVTMPAVTGNFTCVKSNGPLLGSGLLSTQVDISWPAVTNAPEGAQYRIVVTRQGVAQSATMPLSSEPTVNFRVGLLGDPLGILLGSSGTLKITVSTVLVDTSGTVTWSSPPTAEYAFGYNAPVLILGGGYYCL
ncbi:hypothetical protein [Mycetocola saprophilus]|uniref:hypothetical protein n=1 Tax=Mycetocola saprophilus TaxID=76636 RepID=UPI0004C16055|nr:hypothetical protein [Mycetocola saprophilus]